MLRRWTLPRPALHVPVMWRMWPPATLEESHCCVARNISFYLFKFFLFVLDWCASRPFFQCEVFVLTLLVRKLFSSPLVVSCKNSYFCTFYLRAERRCGSKEEEEEDEMITLQTERVVAQRANNVDAERGRIKKEATHTKFASPNSALATCICLHAVLCIFQRPTGVESLWIMYLKALGVES